VIRQNLKAEKALPTLELYNLENDPGELVNLAHHHPEIITQASKIFAKEHRNAELDRFRIPMVEKGLNFEK
jgi:arylsulfatase A-like enzyme